MFACCNNNPIMLCDSGGSRPIESTTVSGESAYNRSLSCQHMCTNYPDVGSAPSYVEYDVTEKSRENSPNCYAYAIGIYDKSYDPGDFSKPFYLPNVASVAKAVQRDFNELNRGCRIIDSYDSYISEDEYRIALRVREVSFFISWDYHFMVQTDSGRWAEKYGPSGPTEYHHTGNPDTISWGIGYSEGLYSSDIIYFAITR